ncbi:NAD(P)/FAD-dependent oxidoreductase [Streptomyces sp. BR1]|uniref:NAD(P)/FAD-dependent oxidoreductase n=1 Tax=Streptomyces sp. BR1 TaxID=1592323 RepID=UPI00402B1561
MPKRHPLDAVIVGAGVVGAACAYYASRSGLGVAVVDRAPVAGGTTGAGEGHLLVSDKEPGPELDLALLSTRLWRDLAHVLPPETQYERRGGLVVAPDEAALAALRALAARQREAGVDAREITTDRMYDLEPYLAPDLAGAVHYPQDAQVAPDQAAAQLLRAARHFGADIRLGEEAEEVLLGPGGRVRGVRTAQGDLSAPAVVNAAGIRGGEFAALAGTGLPVHPRRGFALVTEPLPRVVRQRVYCASGATVVEATASGRVLIGATHCERPLSVEGLHRLSGRAAALFPFLAGVRTIRTYRGSWPCLPDRLPAIGPDPRVPGLLHACGHEGAGIGLAPGTGLLVASALRGQRPALDLRPFRPDRFARVDVDGLPASAS